MTGEKGGLLAGLRAEALKSRHAAPVRLAVLMALPMPLLGAMPYRGVQIFSAWNYWYALFLPVALSLVVACVARADARTRMRGLLGLGFPLGRAWWAKALWCLALCTLSNLVVFGIYLAGSAFSSQGLTAAGTLTMLLCALANTVTAAWMIPAGLFLTARLGMLAGIFCPLAAQLVGGFAWSLMPLPQLFPPSASMVIPTSFIPVLPSGEPLAADMALGGALTALWSTPPSTRARAWRFPATSRADTSSSRSPTTDRASLPPPSNAAVSASSQTTPPAPRATEAATTGSASTPPPRPRAPTGAPSRSPTAPRAAR